MAREAITPNLFITTARKIDDFPVTRRPRKFKFDGGGYRAGGKAMFDSDGNLWVGDNFTVGGQGQDAL